jgi:hypothetical protein
MTRRGPGAHVLARKGTHEKLEGQLEMSLRPPKEELMLAAYGGKSSSWSRDFLQQIMTYESFRLSDYTRAMGRSYVEETLDAIPDTYRVTATEVARRERDALAGIRMVDFRGRVYPQLTEDYFAPIRGRRADILVLDDVG